MLEARDNVLARWDRPFHHLLLKKIEGNGHLHVLPWVYFLEFLRKRNLWESFLLWISGVSAKSMPAFHQHHCTFLGGFRVGLGQRQWHHWHCVLGIWPKPATGLAHPSHCRGSWPRKGLTCEVIRPGSVIVAVTQRKEFAVWACVLLCLVMIPSELHLAGSILPCSSPLFKCQVLRKANHSTVALLLPVYHSCLSNFYFNFLLCTCVL